MDYPEKYPLQGLVLSSILRDSSIVGTRQMHNRRTHAFFLKLQGTTEYHIDGRTLLLNEGEVLLVEKGSSYSIRGLNPGYSYIINFESNARFPQPLCKLPLPQGFDIRPLAEKLYRSWQKENTYAALAAVYQLLDKSASATQPESYISPQEKLRLEPVMTYLEQQLTSPELKLETLSRLAGVSDTYLRRIFKKQHGISPAGFVLRERIRLAKQLLSSGEALQITQVAARVGYSDPLYFSRIFKKQTGLTPSEYRDIHLGDLF